MSQQDPTVDSVLAEIEAQCVALVEAFKVPTHAYLGKREYTVMQGLPRHAPVSDGPFVGGPQQGPVKSIYTTCGSVAILPHPASQLIAVGYMTPDYAVADRPNATSQEQVDTYELVDALDDLHKTVDLPIVGTVKVQKLDSLVLVQIPQTADMPLNFQQIQQFKSLLKRELPDQHFLVFLHSTPIRFLRRRKV